MRMDRWFAYESGHAWCESAYKYQIVSVVAEFANTGKKMSCKKKRGNRSRTSLFSQLISNVKLFSKNVVEGSSSKDSTVTFVMLLEENILKALPKWHFSNFRKSIIYLFMNIQVTNIPFIVLPNVSVLLIRPYIQTVNWIIILPHVLLTLIGIASTYYHATLNLFGQLIDEISILWLLMMCSATYFPVCSFYPQQFQKYVGRVRCAIVLITVVASTLCFLEPSLNAVVLMFFSIPSIIIIYYEAANAGIPEIINFPRKILTLWIAASICWVSDRVFCNFWLFLGIPYFHALFHLLTSLAVHNVFIMFSLIDICRHSDEHQYKCRIKYFPEKGLIRLPYVTLNLDYKNL